MIIVSYRPVNCDNVTYCSPAYWTDLIQGCKGVTVIISDIQSVQVSGLLRLGTPVKVIKAGVTQILAHVFV